MITFNIKSLRMKKKLTQGKLASILNIRTQTLGNYENNKGEPKTISINLIDGLCEQLSCSVGELMVYTPNNETETENNSQSMEEILSSLSEAQSTIKELRSRIDAIEKKDS